MAILFGTTSDGESLPVQVNASGQLVAVGMDGPQGPEGPEGPPGPEGPEGPPGPGGGGEVIPEYGTWTPRFLSRSGGSGIFEFESCEGYWYKVGGILTLWFEMKTSAVVITDARGPIEITDFPEPFLTSESSAVRQGMYSIGEWGGFKPQVETPPYLQMKGNGDSLRMMKRRIPTPTYFTFADFDEQNPKNNWIGGTWQGISASDFALENGLLIRKT